MTREQLKQAAMEYCGEDTRLQSAFMFGADYAWEHPHWIPVEERLPKEKGKLFLVCDKYGRVCESAYDVEDDIWYRQSGVVLNPTHWMPMPEAPRKQQY